MNEFQQGFSGMPGAQAQFMPQGFLGGLLGGPVGGLIGKGIGGLFGNPSLGSQIGQVAGGIGGALLPFGTDPTTAYLQQLQQQQLQQQLAPQGLVGDLLGQFGQPLGNAIGGAFGNAQLGGTIGSLAGQLGKLLPFGVDPAAAYGQGLQQDLSPQNIMGIPPHIRDRILSTLPRFPNTGWPMGGIPTTAMPNFSKLLPFGVDPMTAAAYEQQLQQQQQLAPQGFFGNLLGTVGRPLGGLIGGAFGNQQLGNTIGGLAGQLGKMLPFGVDPMTAAAYEQQLQQQQLAPQGFFGNLLGTVGRPLGGLIGGAFGNQQLGNTIGGSAGQLGKMLPFGVDPMTAAAYEQQLQQQQQLAPQGFFGNLLGTVGRPLGGLIGGAFGNQQLGNTIGGIAGQLGKMLPFGVDPMTAAAYEQQLQQQLQQQQQLAPQGFFGNLLGTVGRPLGGLIGGAFGNQQLGNTIGGLAGQLGKMLPFGVDPWSQQYAAYGMQPQGAQVMAGPFGAGQQQGAGVQQPTIH